MINVFIDGAEGTTGLRLENRLNGMEGVKLLRIEEEKRKDAERRKHFINSADAVFLCLPDEAAREAVTLAGNHVVIIDASTAHRAAPGWAYGFPELSQKHRDAVKASNRITVPGCHASGFNALVYPLVCSGTVSADEVLYCTSLTGYSGGGKPVMAEYEGEDPPRGARPYALGLTHKHLPEMRAVCGLERAPIFMPVLTAVRQGMLVSVPLNAPAEPIHKELADWYRGAEHVRVMPFGGEGSLENGRLNMETLNSADDMEIFVFGNDCQTLLTARLDNLGKGASGAALQCMKLRFSI